MEIKSEKKRTNREGNYHRNLERKHILEKRLKGAYDRRQELQDGNEKK